MGKGENAKYDAVGSKEKYFILYKCKKYGNKYAIHAYTHGPVTGSGFMQ